MVRGGAVVHRCGEGARECQAAGKAPGYRLLIVAGALKAVGGERADREQGEQVIGPIDIGLGDRAVS